MFHSLSKHLKFLQKYSAGRRIFTELSSRCLGILMKHCLLCLIYYIDGCDETYQQFRNSRGSYKYDRSENGTWLCYIRNRRSSAKNVRTQVPKMYTHQALTAAYKDIVLKKFDCSFLKVSRHCSHRENFLCRNSLFSKQIWYENILFWELFGMEGVAQAKYSNELIA